MDAKAHWERVYSTKASTELSWHQEVPTRSLELIREVSTGPETEIIDIGGGDSSLVDAVVTEALGRMTVLDMAGAALARARARLGARASAVTWLEADVTRTALPVHRFDVWHDRAVYHFLSDADDRSRYAAAAASALRRGGTLVMATFAIEGPTRCSGLDVMRYSPESLAQSLGGDFALERGLVDVHRTPMGGEQRFTFAVLRRR